jgi:hypothetical protein
MTALLMDGFDHYGQDAVGAANMSLGAYAAVVQVAPEIPSWGPRTGLYALAASGAGTVGLSYAVPTPGTHFFQSFGYAESTFNATFGPVTATICEFRDGGGALICYLQHTPTGALDLLGPTGTVLGTTSGPVIVPQNWHFFEMEIDSSAHTFKLRVDDAAAALSPVLSVTNAAITGTIALLTYLTSGRAGTPPHYIDDLFVRDAAGSVNNGFLGDRRIATLNANGDTTTAGWTPNYYKKLGAGILDVLPTDIHGNLSGAWALDNSSQNIGSGDFTIESFVRFQSLPTGSNKAVIFGKYDETHNQRSYQLFLGSQSLNNGSLCFQTSTDGSVSTVAQPIVYPFTPNLDQWYHFAVVRSSGFLFLYVDGQQLGLPIADSNTYFTGTARFGLGCQPDNAGGLPILAGSTFNGWLDEFRLTVGFARYMANFTPATVEFPRGSPADPQWTDVSLLAGFDSLIQDESLHNTTMASQVAVQQTVNDGPLIGAFSTIGKVIPDDSTFIAAPFLPATGTLTATANFANNETVTVGTKAAATPAVYTYKTVLTGAAFEVLIDTNVQNSLQNLFNAINAGPGVGTKYGTGTTANLDVIASQLPAGQMLVTALTAGTAGNSIASTETGANSSWTGTTLSGGTSIPGPSNFKIQRPPPRTTLVSAIQITTRALKSDSGLGTFNTALVGALGGVGTGTTHALTVGPSYYRDIFEIDPDTSGPISPATLVNGAIQINRDT